MQTKCLHIISFDNPYPPNYGGIIDVYYKIKALHELGVEINLHIFSKNNTNLGNLPKLCANIYRYPQSQSLIKLFSVLPFSVASRTSKLLNKRLQDTNAPILFESLRTLSPIKHITNNFTIAVRCHNIEHKYSFGLFKSEHHLLKKTANYFEGYKQLHFESVLNRANYLFTLSKHEQEYFSSNFKNKSVYLPVFHGNNKIKSINGLGKYALYHGDLSIADNIKSAEFLIQVFEVLNFKLIIASSTEVNRINKLIKDKDNISFQKINNAKQLEELIVNAHINTLYSFQQSGTKLKAINVLFNGRHCMLNTNVIDDEKVIKLCHVANTIEDYRQKITELFYKPFVLNQERKDILNSVYNNKKNAEKIIALLM